MAEISLDRFLQVCRKSQLVAETDLDSLWDELHQDSSSKRPSTAEQMAQRLIDSGLLNRWQTDNLLKGKYRGFTLGKYTLLDQLGRGGMSTVYLAEHPVMERLVAIKVLPKRHLENQNYLDRFRREARAVAALDHPNIVRAYDIDQDGDTHYIVMEYVDGSDLQAIVREQGVLDPMVAADYVAQAALGLQHAHEAGLIHRDVKPANCLVDKRGVVKLLDLGLAKFSEDDHPALSAIYDDSVVGTADYLAPEQALNSQTVDSRADIYGLGCTLYFCLTGQPPFPEGSIATRLMKHQSEEPKSVFELRRGVPPILVDICRRMMMKSPDQRIQSAALLADEMTQWLARNGRASTYLRSQTSSVASVDSSAGVSSRRSGPSTKAIPAPGTPSARPPPSDTVSSSQGDTSRIRATASSLNDNLSLAPIEEEKPREPSPSPTTEASKSSAVLPVPPPEESVVLDRHGIREYESGPLDALMRDDKFSHSATLPRRQLTSKKTQPEKISAPMVMLITVLTLFGLAAAILIGTIIYTTLASPVP